MQHVFCFRLSWFCAVLLALTAPVSLAHKDQPHGASTAVPAGTAVSPNASVTIVDGWRESGPEMIRVTQGDAVAIRFISNQADELHLHGYDITVPLVPGKPAMLMFVAEHPGRFGYELHQAHREIGVIEVYPK